MDRAVSVERLYSLGDYKNIKFTDSISGIPEHVAMDTEAMDLLRYIQLLEVEQSHKRYIKLAEKLNLDKLDEILAVIEEERHNTWEQLLAKFTQLDKPEEEEKEEQNNE